MDPVNPADFEDSSPEDTVAADQDPHAVGYIVSVPGAISESSYGYPMSEAAAW
jgi:hypothetical protein